jgi:vancomycin permeability regulator SanA
VQLSILHPGSTPDPRRQSLAPIIARALALFFGGFSLLNLLGDLRHPGFDASLWWIDLRILPSPLPAIFLCLASICLLNFAARPPNSPRLRALTIAIVGLLAAATLWNTLEFYSLLFRGRLHALLPIPLSLIFLAALCLILSVNLRPAQLRPTRPLSLPLFAAFAACVISFPLAQMIGFGKTDYRRPADVAVVFGAHVYADGRPSDVLADRVKTACQLYKDGLVKKLIFSGGPGDGPIRETEAMRRLALKLGVNPADILTDTAGLNSQATVNDTLPLFTQLHAHRVIVVSHFYHLPRIKMAYQRAGWDVYTVPARETRPSGNPYTLAREVAALWVYYFRPLVS